MKTTNVVDDPVVNEPVAQPRTLDAVDFHPAQSSPVMSFINIIYVFLPFEYPILRELGRVDQCKLCRLNLVKTLQKH